MHEVTHSRLLVCGHAKKDHEDSAVDVPQSLLHLQWKVQLLIITPGRSEVRGQRSKYIITSEICCFVYCHFVYSTVGSISAKPGTCFSHSIAYIKYVYIPSH